MNIVKFADVAHRANTKEDRFATDKIYYVGGEHIDTNELIIHHKGIIKGSTIGPMFYCGFKSGQILFVTRNPHLKKCSIANFDGICSEKTFVIESINKSILLQEYLAIVMQTNDFWNYCEENKSGGVNYFVNWSTLAEYEFELPPLTEQKRLVEKVWSAYRLKESYKRLLTATQELVKSRFIEMFGGGKYVPVMLDNLADEWLKGQAFKKDSLSDHGRNKCIHYGELFTKYGPIIEEVLSTSDDVIIKASKFGDILFPASDVTPDGLARCSALMQDNVLLGGDIIVLRPKIGISPEYLSWAINMQKEQLLRRVTGSVVRHISAKGLKSVEVPIAPLDKQQEFISIVRQFDKSVFEIKKSIEAIDAVIKSLING